MPIQLPDRLLSQADLVNGLKEDLGKIEAGLNGQLGNLASWMIQLMCSWATAKRNSPSRTMQAKESCIWEYLMPKVSMKSPYLLYKIRREDFAAPGDV